MRNIIFITLLFFFIPLIGFAQEKVKLTDFTISRVDLQDRNRYYYLLDLNDSFSEKITIKISVEPAEIIDSYFDDQYLVMIYKGIDGFHYLTGIYKYGDKWQADYFDIDLEFGTGTYAETIKKAQVLDSATIFLLYNIQATGKAPRTESRILRITKDHIRTYKINDYVSDYDPDGDNPIRPVY